MQMVIFCVKYVTNLSFGINAELYCPLAVQPIVVISSIVNLF